MNHGSPINVQIKSTHETPLILAARNGHTEMCSLLLSRGANPLLSDAMGYSPLDYAREDNNKPLIEILTNEINKRKNARSDFYDIL